MTRFIIVERDMMLKDCGVFTGQIQIIETKLMSDGAGNQVQASDGISSPDIEHAFLFHFAARAWHYAMGFEPHWDEDRKRYFAFRRWIVRKDGEYFPGECVHRQEPIGDYTGAGIAREMLMRARMDAFEQGRESALRELS
jgi:hypothetical protein